MSLRWCDLSDESSNLLSLNSAWADRFFDAGLVVLGAVISIMTAWAFEHWRLKLRDQETASSIVRKFFVAYNGILAVKRQLDECIAAAGGVEPNDYWSVVTQIVGGPDEFNELDGAELAILHRCGEAELYNDISEILRAHRITATTIEKYNQLRASTQDAAAQHVRFEQRADGRHVGRVELAPDENPVVYGKILDCNSLVVNTLDTLARVEPRAVATRAKLNVAIKRHKRVWGNVAEIGEPVEEPGL